MDFFNSLAQVAKNQKNFKTWEDEQSNNNAQRQELAQRRQYTKAELEAAKQLGETIIDVVDIMDNHSENVAENVETAVEPVVALVPMATFFGGGALVVKKIIEPAGKVIRELKEKHFWDNEEAHKLADKITEDIHKTRKNKDRFYASDFASKKYVDSIKNPELKKQAEELHKAFMNEAKSHFRKVKGGGLAILGLTIASFIGSNIMASSLQVGSSKVARYQARKILEDPKAFVNYTPEQIEAAKKYIEDHPELKKEKKKDKLKGGLFKSIYNVIKDTKAYKKSKAEEAKTSKKVDRVLTAEELKQAKKDKEVIQRSVRIINNEAEKYSENMEVAAGVIMGSTPIIGGFCGWLAGLVMNKTGLTNKIINNTVDKYASDEAKEAYKRFRELKEGAPGYTARWSKFASAMKKDKDRVAGKPSAKNALSETVIPKVKKMFAVGLAHKWGNAKIIGLIGAFASAIPASLIALKLQKSAARAGRYTAKRELEKDPTNFIGYTEEDYNEVKDVKGKKQTFGQKVKELALFVPNVLKQYYAYDKYKRTEFKDQQLLMEQLQKSENISSEQLRDAKNLQRKLFNTFEKVDDNSQIYSESMEAAVEIAQPFALYAGMLTAISPLLITAHQLAKGKLSAASLTESISKKLANASNFLKSKTFTKYLDDVSKNIPHKVGGVDVQNKPLAALFSGVDFENDTIAQMGSKMLENIRNDSSTFRMLDDYGQIKVVENIEKPIKNLQERLDIDHPIFKKLQDLFEFLKSSDLSTQERADLLDLYTVNTDVLNRMTGAQKMRLAEAHSKLTWHFKGGETAMQNLLDHMFKNKELYTDFLDAYGCPRGIFDKEAFIKAEIKVNGGLEAVVEGMNSVLESSKKAFNSDNFAFKLKQVPLWLDWFARKFHYEETNPERLLKGKFDPNGSKTPTLDAVLKKYKLKPDFDTLKTRIENMTDDEFQDLADKMHFSSMDRARMLRIIPNLQKIVDNIPKEQLEKIMGTLGQEFLKNPDEVVKLVSSGRIAQIFMTKALVNTAAAMGITWVALNVLLTWAIQSWLADLQLKAGRLGVMKAMESLDDPAYYADIEPAEKKSVQTVPINKNVKPAQPKYVSQAQSNLLDKYRTK